MTSSNRANGTEKIPPIGLNKNGSSITAIVIDDTFTERRIMAQILRSSGFDVIGEAEDGHAGLRMALDLKPQLIILDYYMPKMDGLDTLKQIKRVNPNTCVIMSTSESDKDIAVEIFKTGADDYIVKPLDRLIVIRKLENVVERIRNHR